MMKNVSAGGGRGGHAHRNLWRFVAHLEAEIFKQKGCNLSIWVTASSLEILLIFHPFFIKHKTTETSRYFPPWGAQEVHLTSLSLICVKSTNQQDRFHQFQIECYHVQCGHGWCRNEGSPGGEDLKPFQASRVTYYIHFVCR